MCGGVWLGMVVLVIYSTLCIKRVANNDDMQVVTSLKCKVVLTDDKEGQSLLMSLCKSLVARVVQAYILTECEIFISKHEGEEGLMLKLRCRVTVFICETFGERRIC